jgi:hypothetical protein
VPPGPPTLRAGHLGSQGGLGLLLDQRALNSRQKIHGLTPLKTQRAGGQGVSIHRQHLANHARGIRIVASLDNDLHGDLHSPGQHDAQLTHGGTREQSSIRHRAILAPPAKGHPEGPTVPDRPPPTVFPALDTARGRVRASPP